MFRQKSDDIVTRLRERGEWDTHPMGGREWFPDELCEEAADEIERLREAGDWMWEAMSRHDNTRECPQCQDMIRLWKVVRGE